jgi:hypothetical protein
MCSHSALPTHYASPCRSPFDPCPPPRRINLRKLSEICIAHQHSMACSSARATQHASRTDVSPLRQHRRVARPPFTLRRVKAKSASSTSSSKRAPTSKQKTTWRCPWLSPHGPVTTHPPLPPLQHCHPLHPIALSRRCPHVVRVALNSILPLHTTCPRPLRRLRPSFVLPASIPPPLCRQLTAACAQWATPILFATERDHSAVVKHLVMKGADVKATNRVHARPPPCSRRTCHPVSLPEHAPR